jgi:hypothetical protein
VTWDTVVIHWLTFGSSAKAERYLTHSTQASIGIPLIQHLTSTEPGAEVVANELLKEPPSAFTRGPSVTHSGNVCIKCSNNA